MWWSLLKDIRNLCVLTFLLLVKAEQHNWPKKKKKERRIDPSLVILRSINLYVHSFLSCFVPLDKYNVLSILPFYKYITYNSRDDSLLKDTRNLCVLTFLPLVKVEQRNWKKKRINPSFWQKRKNVKGIFGNIFFIKLIDWLFEELRNWWHFMAGMICWWWWVEAVA